MCLSLIYALTSLHREYSKCVTNLRADFTAQSIVIFFQTVEMSLSLMVMLTTITTTTTTLVMTLLITMTKNDDAVTTTMTVTTKMVKIAFKNV